MKGGEQLFLDNDEQGKQINICSDCKQKRGKKPMGLSHCSKCGEGMPPMITKEMEEKKMCWKCLETEKNEDPNNPHNKDKNLCIKCKKNEIGTNTQNLCLECFEKGRPTEDPNKIPNRKPKPGECCENCGASSIVNQTKTSYT